MMKNIEKIQDISCAQDYKNLSERDKDKLALQYEPLVNKITRQFQETTKIDWNSIKSMAYEGLVIAFNTYDSKRSKMKFLNFAAYAMRNNILTSIDNELRTVKLSNYAQKKATMRGESLFNTVSMTAVAEKDNNLDRFSKEYQYKLYESDKFSAGDPYEYLYGRLKKAFSKKDLEIFYKCYGLNGYKDMKNKDIAHEYHVSEGLISQKIKKIITYIRNDEDLREMLGSMLTV